jgi:hypothetical protein
MNVGDYFDRAPKADKQTLELDREDMVYFRRKTSYTQLQG